MENTTKKGSKGLIVALIGLGIVVIGGITYYAMNQYNRLKDFCIVFLKTKTKVNFLGINKTDITLFFNLMNRSDIPATIDGYTIDIFVNGTKVSSAYSQTLIDVSANGFSTVPVNIVFNPLQVLKIGIANITDLLLPENRDKVVISAEGKFFGIKSSVLKLKELPISFTTNLKELTAKDSTDDEPVCV